MRAAIAFVVILLSACAVLGNDWTYRNGFYYYQHGQDAYNRYQAAGYWSCGRFVPGQYTYQLAYPQPAVQVNVNASSATAKGYRETFAEILKEREEHNNFLDAAAKLNIAPLPGYRGYSPGYVPGRYMPYQLTGHLYYNATPVNSNYDDASFKELLASYGDNNADQMLLTFAQIVDSLNKQSGDTTDKLGVIVDSNAKGRLALADKLLNGRLSIAFLRTLQTKGAESSGFKFNVKPAKDQPKELPKIQPEEEDVAAQVQAAWIADAKARCVSCHGGATPKKGFDVLRDYPKMSRAQKIAKVWPRVFAEDPKVRMPLAEDGSPGKISTEEQKQLWLLY